MANTIIRVIPWADLNPRSSCIVPCALCPGPCHYASLNWNEHPIVLSISIKIKTIWATTMTSQEARAICLLLLLLLLHVHTLYWQYLSLSDRVSLTKTTRNNTTAWRPYASNFTYYSYEVISPILFICTTSQWDTLATSIRGTDRQRDRRSHVCH